MQEHVLVLNCGSSSVKFNLYQIGERNVLNGVLQGIAEEIGNKGSSRLRYGTNGGKTTLPVALETHRDALASIFDRIDKQGINLASIVSVGHRVVHGGDRYKSSVLVDRNVLRTIRDLFPIAPLHNPPNLTGLEESIKLLPDVPQVAVFDTAFHESMPEYAYRYAVPDAWFRTYGVRKYGFHGTSHMYVARRAARFLGIPFDRFCGITAHLGNGCSIAKVVNGKSTDTSMGFTPLEGVAMGTRSGDLDPALIEYVAGKLEQEQGMDRVEAFEKVLYDLNKESGLKAMAGTNMMQDIRTRALDGDPEAAAAIDVYAYRIAGYIGRYWATMPRTDALVFTAGVGENEAYIREKILGFLGNLHITLDPEKNGIRGEEIRIGTGGTDSKAEFAVLVLPTDEESVIGYDALYIGYLGQEAPDRYPFEQ